MEKKFRNILIGLSIFTLLLFLIDSYFDISNLEKDQNIIFDSDKLQQYVRGLALSLLILIITIAIIEIYIRNLQEIKRREESTAQLNKAIKLLVLSLKAYQKKLYFLLYDDSRKDIINYSPNFPFKYLANIFDKNINLSSTFLIKTRLKDYNYAYNQFKSELWSVYLNSNLPTDSNLYVILNELVDNLEENENFESLIDYSQSPKLQEFTLNLVRESKIKMEVTASNALNPYIYLYKSINSILNFKEKLKGL
ncbi:hypothetical protein [Chryseobacterium sp. W4I1]|uniref:hypothetical protein n=1 Tax=Chryseobacterium sp. W4I1 TaxID=3042293 RepID=UPI0027876D32|nr:hypothetical protein [Chryseobacterium sp. W4I1]MDQ0782320.1 hypothetical protein [Chryseobacterium sp. W4I1]